MSYHKTLKNDIIRINYENILVFSRSSPAEDGDLCKKGLGLELEVKLAVLSIPNSDKLHDFKSRFSTSLNVSVVTGFCVSMVTLFCVSASETVNTSSSDSLLIMGVISGSVEMELTVGGTVRLDGSSNPEEEESGEIVLKHACWGRVATKNTKPTSPLFNQDHDEHEMPQITYRKVPKILQILFLGIE